MRRPATILLPLLVLLAACSGNSGHRDGPSASTALTAVPAASAPAEAATAATSAAAAIPAATQPATTAAAAPPSGDAAMRHVRALAADIGPRPAGTAEERAAADYIAARLREAGYEVDLQRFPVKTFVSRNVSFAVTAPSQETFRVAPFKDTVSGSATADVVYAGLGYPADYPSGGVAGRIALVQRGELTFGDKMRNAAAAGASAIIIFDPPNDVISGSITGAGNAIPALTIPGADGVRLRDQLAQGPVRAALSFDGGAVQEQATNVIGRPSGHDCAAVVGGHYDTVPGAPGGSDNASGTAAMLELARVQAGRGNPEQACFIAFSGEELGLLGSQYYLAQLPDTSRRAIKFMINFDMVAVGDEWLFIGSPALVRHAQEIAAAEGVTGRRSELVGSSSDHAAFIDRRIPAVMLHRSNDNLLHTPQDTADRIRPEPLEDAVRLGLAWLAALGQG